jgi:hypothetical protein
VFGLGFVLVEATFVKLSITAIEMENWPSVTCTITADSQLTYSYEAEYGGVLHETREVYTVNYEVDGMNQNSTTKNVQGVNYNPGDQTICVYNPNNVQEFYFMQFLESLQTSYLKAFVSFIGIDLLLLGTSYLFLASCFIGLCSNNNALEYEIPQITPGNEPDWSKFDEDIPKECILQVAGYLSLFEDGSEIRGAKKLPLSKSSSFGKFMASFTGCSLFFIAQTTTCTVFIWWGDDFLTRGDVIVLICLGLFVIQVLPGLMAWVGVFLLVGIGRFGRPPYLFIASEQLILLHSNMGNLFAGPEYRLTSFTWDKHSVYCKTLKNTEEGFTEYGVFYGDQLIASVSEEPLAKELRNWILSFETPMDEA